MKIFFVEIYLYFVKCLQPRIREKTKTSIGLQFRVKNGYLLFCGGGGAVEVILDDFFSEIV